MTIETANRLYELRKKNNLSQEELAEKLGVSRQAVSKWERSEASPDTDNLIALAKLYGLSLDDLVWGEKADKDEESQSRSEDTDGEQSSEAEANKKNDKTFIHFEDESGDRVTIGSNGIVVEEKSGETVSIGWTGLKINVNRSDDKTGGRIIVDDDGSINIDVSKQKKSKTKFWLELPYPIICVIAYLICGFLDLLGGWHPAWIIFITIPVYYTLVEAIYAKSFSAFAYPVLCAVIYLVLGCYFNNWHPSWLIFITVPVYYPIAAALDKKIHGPSFEPDDDDEDDDGE